MTPERNILQFVFRGAVVRLSAFDAHRTLLHWLRSEGSASGVKEGCAEGDCGACTVVLRRLNGGDANWRAVNACILLLGQVDGAEILTIEDLAVDGNLHPVQQALVDHHGSQCGFCTPGIAMSLAALHAHGSADRAAVVDALAGNLCRCTGYRPIIDAALAANAKAVSDQFSARRTHADQRLASIDDERDVLIKQDAGFFAAPFHENSLAKLLADHPDAVIVSGATDVGLQLTKALAQPEKIIWTGRVRSLRQTAADEDAITIGAGTTIAEAMTVIGGLDPDLHAMLRRFGSVQVRNSGTVGGNIANGSPIGDLPPVLIALGAEIELRASNGKRRMPLEQFFLSYRKQDRRADEYVGSVRVPKLKPGEHVRIFKLTKRRDEDISTVCMAIKAVVDGRVIRSARIACGGMAAVPARASQTERALENLSLDSVEAWQRPSQALQQDFSPITDQRASADYRMQAAKNLLFKILVEVSGADDDVRIADFRPRSVVNA